MAKFASILIIVGVIINVQGFEPPYEHDKILTAAKENQWDQIQQLLRNNFGKSAEFKIPTYGPDTFNDVRNLKPVNGGHVYGEAEYSYHSSSNVNGKTSEDHAGHKVINSDGMVKEFDFTPKPDLPRFIQPIIPPIQIGNAFGASEKDIQYTPSSASQTADYFKIGQPHITIDVPPQSFASQNQGAQGGHNAFNSQYAYSQSHSYVNGKPVAHLGVLPNLGANLLPDTQPFSDVRNLRPPQGGKVFGEAEYTYHTASNINGKVSEDQGGHKIINNNGQVQEFDFTPNH